MIEKSIRWTVSPHAKQRAWERYGIRFSPRKWTDFCRALQKEKNLICLKKSGPEGSRFACCFRGQWFFIGCCIRRGHGMVATFLPTDALTDADKTILASDVRYIRTGGGTSSVMHPNLSGRTTPARRTNLLDIQIVQEELPPDFDLVNKLLDGS